MVGQILSFASNYNWNHLYNIFFVEVYVLEKQCEAGTAVLNVAECKKACGTLGISRLGAFKEGRPCYKGGSGVCNQNVKRPGNKATRICKGIKEQKVNVCPMFW